MTKSFILNFLKTSKTHFNKTYGVTKIGLFGSYARDEQTEDSDIDIAIEIDSKNSFRSFFGLKKEIEQKLGKKIDLGIESALKPIAKKHIQKDLIYV